MEPEFCIGYHTKGSGVYSRLRSSIHICIENWPGNRVAFYGDNDTLKCHLLSRTWVCKKVLYSSIEFLVTKVVCLVAKRKWEKKKTFQAKGLPPEKEKKVSP